MKAVPTVKKLAVLTSRVSKIKEKRQTQEDRSKARQFPFRISPEDRPPMHLGDEDKENCGG